MRRKKLILAVFAVLIVAVLFAPGCDKLVTEITEVTIAGHPTADFLVDIDSGCVPLTVQFTDQSTGPRTKWTWWFGDGDSSSDTNPTHTYDSAGVYEVKLKIEDEPTEGEDIEVKKRFVLAGKSIADFVASVDSGCPPLEVVFTPIDYSYVSSWQWDFGDGSPFSNNPIDTHLYDSVGEFTVTLTVGGVCGQTVLADTNMIKITECPLIYFLADTLSGCRPLTVTFYDSTDTGEQALVSRNWDFGNDSTSTEQNPTVTYPDAGLYTVTLTVTSTGGTATDSIEDYITVFDSTQAAFAAVSPTGGCLSQYQQFQVKFEDSSTGDITNWAWDFGDGYISYSADPVHAYASPGIYTVILEVGGPCGTDADTNYDYIILADTLQTITFQISPDSGSTSDVFTFTDLSTGIITSRVWDFGDADSSTDSTTTHQFAGAGTYQIALTISNACGSLQASDTVIVTEP